MVFLWSGYRVSVSLSVEGDTYGERYLARQGSGQRFDVLYKEVPSPVPNG